MKVTIEISKTNSGVWKTKTLVVEAKYVKLYLNSKDHVQEVLSDRNHVHVFCNKK